MALAHYLSAHDQRDLDFARKYDLPVIQCFGKDFHPDTFTITDEAYTGDGVIYQSNFNEWMCQRY